MHIEESDEARIYAMFYSIVMNKQIFLTAIALVVVATLGIALGATAHIANSASCTGKPSPGNSHNDGGNAHSTGESDKCSGSK